MAQFLHLFLTTRAHFFSIPLPNRSTAMHSATKRITFFFALLFLSQPLLALATPLPDDEIQPGDLLFFWISDKGRHVGIYLEDGTFFHASTSEGVTISRLDADYWRYRLISVRRVNHNVSLDAFKRAFKQYDPASYKFGAVGPSRFDCSGLVQRVFKEHGVDLPRTTHTQLRTGYKVMSGRDYLRRNRR